MGTPSPTGHTTGSIRYVGTRGIAWQTAQAGELLAVTGALVVADGKVRSPFVPTPRPPWGVAPLAANGEPACHQCHHDLSKAAGRDVEMWSGTFTRLGRLLRCTSCGSVAREPMESTLARYERELDELRRKQLPRRSRLQRRWR